MLTFCVGPFLQTEFYCVRSSRSDLEKEDTEMTSLGFTRMLLISAAVVLLSAENTGSAWAAEEDDALALQETDSEAGADSQTAAG